MGIKTILNPATSVVVAYWLRNKRHVAESLLRNELWQLLETYLFVAELLVFKLKSCLFGHQTGTAVYRLNTAIKYLTGDWRLKRHCSGSTTLIGMISWCLKARDLATCQVRFLIGQNPVSKQKQVQCLPLR